MSRRRHSPGTTRRRRASTGRRQASTARRRISTSTRRHLGCTTTRRRPTADTRSPANRYSDKSKVIAGLLQLLGLFGLVGFGRIYLGQTGLGIAQLVVGIVTCGIGAWIWGIIDAIMIFSGSVRDKDGRPLRDGT